VACQWGIIGGTRSRCRCRAAVRATGLAPLLPHLLYFFQSAVTRTLLAGNAYLRCLRTHLRHSALLLAWRRRRRSGGAPLPAAARCICTEKSATPHLLLHPSHTSCATAHAAALRARLFRQQTSASAKRQDFRAGTSLSMSRNAGRRSGLRVGFVAWNICGRRRFVYPYCTHAMFCYMPLSAYRRNLSALTRLLLCPLPSAYPTTTPAPTAIAGAHLLHSGVCLPSCSAQNTRSDAATCWTLDTLPTVGAMPIDRRQRTFLYYLPCHRHTYRSPPAPTSACASSLPRCFCRLTTSIWASAAASYAGKDIFTFRHGAGTY